MSDRLREAAQSVVDAYDGDSVGMGNLETEESIEALRAALATPATPVAEPPRCSECGIAINEHPLTDACAIAQESREATPVADGDLAAARKDALDVVVGWLVAGMMKATVNTDAEREAFQYVVSGKAEAALARSTVASEEEER